MLNKNQEGCDIMNTVTKKDIIAQGYSAYYAQKIMILAKQHLVQQGYSFYNNSRIMRIPTSAIEHVLNITWKDGV
jgi:hypothetical protein